ncbi:TonB-dependent receptor [Novosphingobium sp. PY1]|uniref:TonB-dependent receptor n=1 Tax=Novosphingobium sp. PY1 TaxID=1882221 RepID=UPI001A8FA1AD|nr:TonB-dependent receptor [Novosphingobium sp. PY1]GFM27624.1 TonB-dependent receptor [Novosphingobium sp. PY1]
MKRLQLVCAILAGTALSSNPVFAQSAETAQDTAQPQENTGNDIVVTAQRQSQRLLDVPLSVQAVSGDTLRDRGITDQRQLGLIAPSLQVQRDNNYSIRGIGTQSFASTIESSVATAIDGVTLGSSILNGNPFLDVARVEVLNGPQGLLFGKNASAGLVNITTERPEIGHYGANFNAQATSNALPGDNADGVQVDSTINVPVTDNSALRVSGIYKYQQPITHYIRDNATGRQDNNFRQYGLRGKYLLEATDQLTVYAIGEYYETHGIGTIFDVTYRQLADGSINEGPVAGDGVTPGDHNFYAGSDAAQYRDLKTGGAQLNLDYELDNGWTLSNIFAWKFYSLGQQIDADSTGQNGANINSTDSRFDQFSEELRLALPSTGPLTGQVGLYYYRSKLDQVSQIAGNNFFTDPLLGNAFCVGPNAPSTCARTNDYFLGTDKDYTSKNESYAAFGQLTYAFNDMFNIFAGGRFTHDKVSIDLVQNTGDYFLTLGVPDGTFKQSFSNDEFSWKFGGQFKPSNDVMFYASYGRGYKGPGMNDTGASLDADLAIYPETTKNFEAGVKSSLLGRMVTINASVFRTIFDNFQIQSFDTELRTFVIGNAAKVKSKGAEAAVTIRPAYGLTLSATGAYADTKFDTYEGAQCYPGQGCGTSGTFDASGYRLAYAPKFTGTIGAAYELPLNDNGLSLLLNADLYHRSKVETVINHAPDSQIGAIDVLNGSIGLRGDAWNLSVFCKNCTNKVYPLAIQIESGDSSAQPTPMLSYTQRWGLDSTRTIGLRFGYNF